MCYCTHAWYDDVCMTKVTQDSLEMSRTNLVNLVVSLEMIVNNHPWWKRNGGDHCAVAVGNEFAHWSAVGAVVVNDDNKVMSAVANLMCWVIDCRLWNEDDYLQEVYHLYCYSQNFGADVLVLLTLGGVNQRQWRHLSPLTSQRCDSKSLVDLVNACYYLFVGEAMTALA